MRRILWLLFFFPLLSPMAYAFPGLVSDSDGNLYVLTHDGQKIPAHFGSAFEDAVKVMKLGPAGVAAPLEIYPFEGGIEGLYPVFGSVRHQKTLSFRWRGEPIQGSRPTLFIFDFGDTDHIPFPISSAQQGIQVSARRIRLKPGKEYRWYLGRIEGNEPVAQSRVFSFKVLTKSQEKRLHADLASVNNLSLDSSDAKDFLKGQVYYNYHLYHDMVTMLEPIYQAHPGPELQQLLFLGYVKIGKRAEAKKFQALLENGVGPH